MAVLWCGDGQLILDGARAERRPFEAADRDFLVEQAAAYTRALTLPTPAATLLAIGKALHDWLDRKNCLSHIIGESGPVSLDLAVTARHGASGRPACRGSRPIATSRCCSWRRRRACRIWTTSARRR